jgi:hypothetical protein
MSFTEDDLTKAKEFGAMLGKAELRLPLDQTAKVYKLLVWFSQVTAKIEANIMELRSVVQEEPPAKPKRGK